MKRVAQICGDIGLQINESKTAIMGLARRMTKQHSFWDPIKILGIALTRNMNAKIFMNEQLKKIRQSANRICDEGAPLRTLNPRVTATFVASALLPQLLTPGFIIEELMKSAVAIEELYRTHMSVVKRIWGIANGVSSRLICHIMVLRPLRPLASRCAEQTLINFQKSWARSLPPELEIDLDSNYCNIDKFRTVKQMEELVDQISERSKNEEQRHPLLTYRLRLKNGKRIIVLILEYNKTMRRA